MKILFDIKKYVGHTMDNSTAITKRFMSCSVILGLLQRMSHFVCPT